MEFITEYGLFLAKIVTAVFAFAVVLALVMAQKQQQRKEGHIDVKKLNEDYEDYEDALNHAVLSEKQFKKIRQEQKKAEKKKEKQEHIKRRIFYITFDGDVEASAVEQLRQEVSAILTIADGNDEVLVNVESAGGMVHTYGLAASQLQRFRQAGIPLTVCVDKVAASGGYLMACVADRIFAAPFALVGSIGVLAQIPNFHRALKKYDVDYELMTAGEFKAPITMFGEITDKGRDKLKEDLENTHVLFKNFITNFRPKVAIDQVATGEVWYGQQALALDLVDTVTTSDDYLMQQYKHKDIYHVRFIEKQSLQKKLGLSLQYGVLAGFKALANKEQLARISKS